MVSLMIYPMDMVYNLNSSTWFLDLKYFICRIRILLTYPLIILDIAIMIELLSTRWARPTFIVAMDRWTNRYLALPESFLSDGGKQVKLSSEIEDNRLDKITSSYVSLSGALCFNRQDWWFCAFFRDQPTPVRCRI